MQFKEKVYDYGVIVGRFQVAELHDGHKQLIETVINRHRRVLILIGVSPTLGTKNSPLDYASRCGLFYEYWVRYNEKIIIGSLSDVPGDDLAWSAELDSQIRAIFPMGSVCLYGGRDSFINYYHGKFDSHEFGIISNAEGKQIRGEWGKKIINSVDFRAGQIYQSQNRFPMIFSTVDIAVVNYMVKNHKKDGFVLMGRKKNKAGYVFPGGFADPTDDGLEAAARRELFEEVDVEVDPKFQYLGSFRIDDPRYTGEERIITTLFGADYLMGSGKPKEELLDTIWIPIREESLDSVADIHKVLFRRLLK